MSKLLDAMVSEFPERCKKSNDEYHFGKWYSVKVKGGFIYSVTSLGTSIPISSFMFQLYVRGILGDFCYIFDNSLVASIEDWRYSVYLNPDLLWEEVANSHSYVYETIDEEEFFYQLILNKKIELPHRDHTKKCSFVYFNRLIR